MRRNQAMNAVALSLAAVIAITLPTVIEAAEDPAAKGEAVARESDRRDLGFGDTKVELKMTLENRRGQTSERRLRIQTLEVPDENDGDKSLVIFDKPRDIRGTALLSYSHILDPDDQWLYLPALKRVKRISSSNKSGPFVGSEFAYEDITAQELKKYSYKWLRDGPCGELECFVICSASTTMTARTLFSRPLPLAITANTSASTGGLTTCSWSITRPARKPDWSMGNTSSELD
jgi:hypothetical protein